MDRDIRKTPLYRDVEAFFERHHRPAFGRISGAADVAAAPDATRLAFTGSKLEKLEGTPSTRICVADVAGVFEEVTAGPNEDRSPSWSPDGTSLAFVSDRKERGRGQVYLLQTGRLGEARAAAEVEGSVEHIAWSPSGSHLLVGAAGTGADLAGVQGSGVAAAAEEEDLPSWAPTVESSEDEEGWRRLWVLNASGREATSASREGLNVWEAAWFGDDAVVAIVSDAPGEDAWYRAALAVIDVASGKERILYRSDRQLGLPAASPDGRRVAVVEAICSDRMIVAGDVRLVDPGTGDASGVDTNGVDVTFLRWRDDRRLFFIGIRDLDTVAGEVDADSGEVTELWSTNESCGFIYPSASLTPDGFVVVREGYDRYPEVAVVEGGAARTVVSLAHEGTEATRADGGRIEPVTWTAPDGLEISGLLSVPDGPQPFPLIAFVHGGPISTYTERWGMRGLIVPLLVSRGYAVFFPNPRGSSGRGQAFAEMVYGDAGGGDAADILAGIDTLVQRGVVDTDRVGVMGGSYGGFMSAWLVTQTERFAAAVSISPVTNWYSQHHTSNIGFWDSEFLRDDPRVPGEYFRRSPLMFARNVRTPTLLTAGLEDRCTPPGQAVEFFQALRESGVETELALYPEEGHGVRKLPASIDFCARVVGWFERYMPSRRDAS